MRQQIFVKNHKSKMKKLVKKTLPFLFFVIIIVGITFLPVIVWQNEISFDKVMFINEWLKLFFEGIYLAGLFYCLTIVFNDFHKKREDEHFGLVCIQELKDIKGAIESHHPHKNLTSSLERISNHIDMINNKKNKTRLISDWDEIKPKIEESIGHIYDRRFPHQPTIDKTNTLITKIEKLCM